MNTTSTVSLGQFRALFWTHLTIFTSFYRLFGTNWQFLKQLEYLSSSKQPKSLVRFKSTTIMLLYKVDNFFKRSHSRKQLKHHQSATLFTKCSRFAIKPDTYIFSVIIHRISQHYSPFNVRCE